MEFKEINEEVLYTTGGIVVLEQNDMNFLKEKAAGIQRKRIRFCAHNDTEDSPQEMFIVHTSDTYVRPHKHLDKAESLYILEGRADLIFFDDEARITDVYELGDYHSGKRFYCRIPEPYYHSLLIYSDFIIFHEVTKGPFVRTNSVFAPWSPADGDFLAVREFLIDIRARLHELKETQLR